MSGVADNEMKTKKDRYMKERTGLILRVIIAIASVVICVLIWMKIIPLPDGWKEIPIALVNLFAAPAFHFIDLFMRKKKEDSGRSGGGVQNGGQSVIIGEGMKGGKIHVGKIVNNPDPKLFLDRIDELHKVIAQAEAEAALAKNELALQKAINTKLNAENAIRSEQPDYKQRALDLRAEGKIKEAIEFIKTDEVVDEAANRHIFTAELLIDNFQFDEAADHYKRAADILPSLENYIKIASFYKVLNRLPDAIEYYKRGLPLANSLEEKAKILDRMGRAQEENNDFSGAQTSYTEALEIYRSLADKNKDEYLPKVATVLHGLGILYDRTQKYEKAFDALYDAIDIYTDIAEKNPDAHLLSRATILCSIGHLHHLTEEYTTSLARYRNSKEIYGKLSNQYPNGEALLDNNMGNLYKDMGKNFDVRYYKEALDAYGSALNTYTKLAEIAPTIFLPQVAQVNHNLSVFYLFNIPNKESSLYYASKAMKTLDKCNNTPFVIEIREKSKMVIEQWNNR